MSCRASPQIVYQGSSHKLEYVGCEWYMREYVGILAVVARIIKTFVIDIGALG